MFAVYIFVFPANFQSYLAYIWPILLYNCIIINCIVILQAPKSVNISENEETFINCTVIGDHINWKANNTPVKDLSSLGFDDSFLPLVINESRHERKGMLKIRGSQSINKTTITCHTILPGGNRSHAKSKPALIQVQGMHVVRIYLLYNFDINIIDRCVGRSDQLIRNQQKL